MSDDNPSIRFEFTNEAGNRRRVTLVKRDPGGWDRVVEERSGDGWRPVGDEIVADVGVEIDNDVTDVVSVTGVGDEPNCRVIRGP